MSEFVEPLGMRVLVRKDESRQTTKGGIVLPDDAEIPTITGRVVEISAQVGNDDDFPINKYDKILFHPKNAIPVDDIVAVFRRAPSPDSGIESASELDERDDEE